MVTVTNYNDLAAAVSASGKRVVQVSGTITGPAGVEMLRVESDKTIIGLGADAIIDGFGFNITSDIDCYDGSTQTGKENIIIQNLTFVNSSDDSVNIECYSHNIWVDHNTFTKSFDGSVDVKRGADFVTVSWNKFVRTTKTMLLGHDDDNGSQDIGYLRVSYHHNLFDHTQQRHPRVRFGEAHVYNNYVIHISAYFIGLGVGCSVYADGNYIEFADAVTESYGGSDITWDSTNIVVGTDHAANSNGQGFDPRGYYQYSPDSAIDIPSIVSNGAGAGNL